MLKFWEYISVITIAIVTIMCITIQVGILGFAIYTHLKKPPVEDNTQTEVEYLIHQIHLRDSVIQTWEDHAVRMKRIAGVPDTVEWSYKQKIIHPIKIK
jgi:hypothetical protein